jgi:hypothetical protein
MLLIMHFAAVLVPALQSLLHSHSQLLLSQSGSGTAPYTHIPDQASQQLQAGPGASPTSPDTSLFLKTMTMTNPLFSSGSLASSVASSTAGMKTLPGPGAVAPAAADGDAPSTPSCTNANTYETVLDNPVFKGKSLLQWLMHKSPSVAQSAASSKVNSASGTAAGAGAGAGPTTSQQQASSRQAAARANQPAPSPDADLARTSYESSYSVESPQLSAFVKERISTPGLSIRTEHAPDMSRFSKHSKVPGSTAAEAHGTHDDAVQEAPEIIYSQDGEQPGGRAWWWGWLVSVSTAQCDETPGLVW